MKKFRWFEVILLVALAIAVVLIILHLQRDNSVVFRQDAAGATKITLADYLVSEEPVDEHLGVRRTYSFSLPSNLAADDCLVLHIMHQYCTVRVGRETRYIYENGKPNFIRTSGRYWACVRLSSADASKTVVVQLTPVYSFAPEPEVVVCPLDRVVSDTLAQDLPLMLLGLLCLILGVSLAAVAMFTVFNQRVKRALMCLAVLTAATGVWKISGLPLMTLLFHMTQSPFLQPKAIYLYDMIGFLFMPVFIIQFLNGMRRSDNTNPETFCAAIMAFIALAAIVLQFAGVVELQVAVPYLAMGSAALLLVMFGLVLYRHENLWLICLPICACTDLLIAQLFGNSRYSIFLMLCIIVSDYVSGMIFIRRTIRQESELRDARTTALQNQIRPHFIHNTLTSIYYLCDSDPQTAKKLVHDFNNHLRANFTSLSLKAPIPFDEEMENVRAYLSVEQVRFSDKLFVEYDTPHTAFLLPALTLQPLVENAVKHNVDSSKPPVHIRIRSMQTNGGSAVVIEDDGVGVTGTLSDDGGHVGLQNVADRLQILCGGTLTVSPRPDGGTIVTVFVPDR